MQIGDRFIDTRPVQDVLRPSIHTAGHDTEQILHAQRGARPVMSLHFRHGNQQVTSEHRIRQIERSKLGLRPLQGDEGDLIEIEIREERIKTRHRREVARGLCQV